MIVKKLYRKVKCKDYNKKSERYDEIITRDYVGYFLFGCIPLYLKLLDERFQWFGNETFQRSVYRKYQEIKL